MEKLSYYERNKERILQQQKEYRENNKEIVRQFKKDYYNKNKELLSKKSMKWQSDNKERRRQYKKEYDKKRNSNPDIKLKNKEYREKHKDKIKIYQAKYRKKRKSKLYHKQYYMKNKNIIRQKARLYYVNRGIYGNPHDKPNINLCIQLSNYIGVPTNVYNLTELCTAESSYNDVIYQTSNIYNDTNRIISKYYKFKEDS